jgi:hypothetical protein
MKERGFAAVGVPDVFAEAQWSDAGVVILHLREKILHAICFCLRTIVLASSQRISSWSSGVESRLCASTNLIRPASVVLVHFGDEGGDFVRGITLFVVVIR